MSFVVGLVGNAAVARWALRRFGSGEGGLRVAARATGQSTLVAYAPYFSTGSARALSAYAGAHVTHLAVLALLLSRHGHPAAGTPFRAVSVYGGLAGYGALVALLSGARAAPARWFLFVGLHGTTIAHGYLAKGRSPAYVAPAGLWLAACAARGSRGAGSTRPSRRASRASRRG
jgi:hypothetical protein